jgi:UDP-N-acetylmuramoyl-L-alanyl-D-glutamate--2,6-diaminopimelate ligase
VELSKVKGITQNSKEVQEGWIFVAIKGSSTDGHNFVQEALSRGASLVFVERDVGLKDDRIIKVEDTRKLLGELANEFFGRPSESLKLVGITGTNGKTTSSHIVESVLNAGGIPTGLVGTIYYRFKDKIYEYEGRTTPDPIQLHRTLKQMLEDGAKAVACEVSRPKACLGHKVFYNCLYKPLPGSSGLSWLYGKLLSGKAEALCRIPTGVFFNKHRR